MSRSERIVLRVSPEDKKAWEAYAKAQEYSGVSDMIRQAVEEKLERDQQQPSGR